jgi:hypothetical protein
MSDDIASRVRRVAAMIFAATLCAYLATAGGTLGTGDAVAMLEAAKALVDRGAMDVPADQSSEAWRGVDGRYYTPFGIGQSLYDIPFLVAGRVAASRTGAFGDRDTLPKAFVAVASTIPAAAAVGFGFLLAWRLSADARASAVAAFVLAFGTLLWPYAKFGFNAALTAGTLTAGVYGIAAGAVDRRAGVLIAGASGLGLALLTRHEMAIASFVAVGWVAWQTRGDRHRPALMLAAVVPIALAIGVWLTLNATRYGDALRTGHDPAFSLDGLRGYLLSPSGALLLYAPPSLAAIGLVAMARSGHAIATLLLVVTAAMIAFYASLEDWLGTRSYGPRYLVPLLPLLVAPLAVWIARLRSRASQFAVGLLCVIGFLVQVPAVAIDFSRAGILAGQPPQSARRDDWHWAPIVVNARMLGPAIASTGRALSSGRPPAAARDRSLALGDSLPFGLNLWWMHLVQLGLLSAGNAVLAGLVPLAAAGWLVHLSVSAASALTRRIPNGAA